MPRIDQCLEHPKDRPRISPDCLRGLKDLLVGDVLHTSQERASVEHGHVGIGSEEQHKNRFIEVANGGMESLEMRVSLTQEGKEPNDMCEDQEQGDAPRGTGREAQDEACVICLDEPSDFACVPCGHRCLCAGCQDKANGVCPICRSDVQGIFRIFL